jgi:hypothetical protein
MYRQRTPGRWLMLNDGYNDNFFWFFGSHEWGVTLVVDV